MIFTKKLVYCFVGKTLTKTLIRRNRFKLSLGKCVCVRERFQTAPKNAYVVFETTKKTLHAVRSV